MANKQVHHRKYPIESNIEAGSGLPSTIPSKHQAPLKIHDGTIVAMTARIPIAPTMNVTTAEQLIRQTKVAATSGDLFMTGIDFSIEKKTKYLFVIQIGQLDKKKENIQLVFVLNQNLDICPLIFMIKIYYRNKNVI
jgi:hypothetical protein